LKASYSSNVQFTIRSFAGICLLGTISACSFSPLSDDDFRIDNAKEEFETRREQAPEISQPKAVRPSETAKVDRPIRVLKVFQGIGSGNKTSSTAAIDGQLESIESGLQVLADTLINTSLSLGVSSNQLPQTQSNQGDPNAPPEEQVSGGTPIEEALSAILINTGATPNSIIEDGYVYLNASTVTFDDSLLINSFQKMYAEGIAKDSRGEYQLSALPLELAISELSRSISVDITMTAPNALLVKRVSAEHRGHASELLDQILNDNGLTVIWDSGAQRAWILDRVEFDRLIEFGRNNARSLAAKRLALRNGFEKRQLAELSSKAQNIIMSIANGQTQTISSELAQIEEIASELSAQTRLEITPVLTSLRKNVSAFDPATNSTPSKTSNTGSILSGEAVVEQTQCLAKGETVKVAKIFTAFIQPETIRDQLVQTLALAGSGGESQESNTENAEETAQAPVQAQATANGCDAIRNLSVRTDQTGIIITGQDSQIDFIANLLDGIDTPKKQVLVEVYLVQVTADWRRELEANLTTLTTNGEISTALGASLVNVTRNGVRGAFTLSGDDQAQTGLGNVLNFLERNDIGRTISSPSILAIDNEPATVKRLRTLRYPETVPATLDDNGNPTSQPGTTYQELELELTLDITPRVIQANNHVELTFQFTEDTIDDETNPEASPQTTNDITTKIETSPGDVVMLAGLYRQSTSDNTDAIPGLSRSGIVAGLTGGANSQLKAQSELLVFIAPTVLEPGNTTN